MFSFSSISLICCILFTWNQVTNGIACYVCTNCNDPFNPTYVGVSYQNDTNYYCRKMVVANNIARDMITSCTSSSTAGTSQWCCQTNLCNSAQKNTLGFLLAISVLKVFF
ncbi:unnamed protein product [Adineta ricciae]|uniref:Uncharacterized protein n=1 Tax=Adineta ricciae TaxID=249248 RepID=A0A814RLT6_ADIRI|nr:unnamed protein product [Adineta ricciae]CAF1337455.1 unnamed protein product [Adineta ricciae]